jgi:hypothetical protein
MFILDLSHLIDDLENIKNSKIFFKYFKNTPNRSLSAIMYHHISTPNTKFNIKLDMFLIEIIHVNYPNYNINYDFDTILEDITPNSFFWNYLLNIEKKNFR